MKLTSLGAAALLSALATGLSAQDDPPARWIVQFEDGGPSLDALRDAIADRDPERAATAVEQARAHARAARERFATELEARGGRVTEVFWLIPACVVEGPDEAIDLAARYPGVRHVRRDEWRRPAGADLLPIRESTNADNHAADGLQAQGIRGAGATIAVVDTGLDTGMASTNRPHAVFYPGGNPTNTTGGGIGGSRVLANVAAGMVGADVSDAHGTRVAAVAAGARWNTTPQSDDGHAPDAKIAGYAISEDIAGTTTLVTMVSAWQHVVADAAALGTNVAVFGYDGTMFADSPEQQAMDVAADVADILVAAAGGNTPNSQFFYHGTVNALAVGATVTGTHAATSFTARGPLNSTTLAPRVYPHLVANGEAIVTPAADNEANNLVATGTSYSAPQVAGAAALFRTVAPTATALETRAALLATAQDVSASNPGTANAIGHGYLRDDRLVELAQGNGLLASGTVDVNQPGRTFSFPVNQNETYAVALSWSRRSVTASQWANLDLRVRLGGQLVASSLRVDDSNERVVFDAPFGGTATIEVDAARFENGRVVQEFAVAAARTFAPRLDEFGQGCGVARGPVSVRYNEPASLPLGTFGNSSRNDLIGGSAHRTQQWVDAGGLQAAFNVRGIALRHDDVAQPSGQRLWVDLTIDLSLNSASALSTMTTTFAQNDGLRKTRVLTRKKVVLPPRLAPNTDPTDWAVVIPFDQAFDRLFDTPPGTLPAQGLVVDVRQFGSSIAGPLSYPLDAVQGPTVLGGVLHATSPNATAGSLTLNAATVVGMIDDLGTVHVPTLSGTGVPSPGGSYALELSGAAPSTFGVLTFGLSRQTYSGVSLPIDLAIIDAPGCFLFTSVDAFSNLSTAPNGTGTANVLVPNVPALTGGRLHHQVLALDPLANALGLTSTNGVTVVIGD